VNRHVVAAAFLALLAAACSADQGSSDIEIGSTSTEVAPVPLLLTGETPSEIVGSWQAVTLVVDGVDLLDDRFGWRLLVELQSDGAWRGLDGCNQFSTSGPTLYRDTSEVCPFIDGLDEAFRTALQQVDIWSIEEGDLLLTAESASMRLASVESAGERLLFQPSPPLAGDWSLTKLVVDNVEFQRTAEWQPRLELPVVGPELAFRRSFLFFDGLNTSGVDRIPQSRSGGTMSTTLLGCRSNCELLALYGRELVQVQEAHRVGNTLTLRSARAEFTFVESEALGRVRLITDTPTQIVGSWFVEHLEVRGEVYIGESTEASYSVVIARGDNGWGYYDGCNHISLEADGIAPRLQTAIGCDFGGSERRIAAQLLNSLGLVDSWERLDGRTVLRSDEVVLVLRRA